MSVTLQKASFWKRISAYLFDAIISVMLAVGFIAGLSAVSPHDEKTEELNNYYTKYEQLYGVDFDISEEDYNELSQAEKDNYTEANKALHEDAGFQDVYRDIFYITLLTFGGGLFLSYLLWYFVIPLFLGYGRTFGKRIFGIAVIRTNCVKASPPVLFIRTTIGLFAIETMLPLSLLIMISFNMMGIVGLITIGLLGILQVAVLIATPTNSSIHCLLTDTVVVDFASQQIFDTQDDLLSYQREELAKAVKQADESRL